MDLASVLPIIIYLLLIVLLIILIILGIKLIFVVNKADNLMSDIQTKVSSFNSVFKLIDVAGDKISVGITSIVEAIINLINKMFKKRKEEDYE